jgi:hypothetical protein
MQMGGQSLIIFHCLFSLETCLFYFVSRKHTLISTGNFIVLVSSKLFSSYYISLASNDNSNRKFSRNLEKSVIKYVEEYAMGNVFLLFAMTNI